MSDPPSTEQAAPADANGDGRGQVAPSGASANGQPPPDAARCGYCDQPGELFTAPGGLGKVCERCLGGALEAQAQLDAAASAALPREIDTPVRFVSPDELLASVPPAPPWRWDGYLAAGAVTALAGKPKAGKSTIALAAAQAVAGTASEFLGHALDGGPVVYVAEEGAATLSHKIADGDLRIATRETAWPRPPWPALVEASQREAQRAGAVLLVVDTFAFWAGLPPEAEKDAGAMQQAMEPLVAAAGAGLAVLLIVHARKGGGEDGEAVRGSSALAAVADIVLELERIPDGTPRQRRVLSLSRYPQTPGVLVIEHDRADRGWSVIGEGTDRGDARDITNRMKLLDALDAGELTRAELEQAAGPERGWHDTMEQLIGGGTVARDGEGKKGSPFRFRILRNGSAQKERRNGDGDVSVSAASPVGSAETETSTAESCAHPACAESDPDAELERLQGKFPDLLSGEEPGA